MAVANKAVASSTVTITRSPIDSLTKKRVLPRAIVRYFAWDRLFGPPGPVSEIKPPG
jgi:hypothetical protein